MNKNKEIYEEIRELFRKQGIVYQNHINSTLGTMSKFIFSAAPAAEKEIVGIIKDDILIFEDMLAGYIYSYIESKKIQDNYNLYLKNHNFYSEEQIQKLAGILNEERRQKLSDYLKDMDRMKSLYESLLTHEDSLSKQKGR